MSYRQSFSDAPRHYSTPAEQIKDLKFEIQLKNHEIQDLKFELNTFRKKQSIWHHLGQTYEKANVQEEKKLVTAENEKLKSQVVSMLAQIERKNETIKQQQQKINDLKQYSIELKKLSQKSQNIHKKQIQFMKSNMESSSEVQLLRKQKQKLEKALSKCDSITKEMEDYYMNQIDLLRQQIEEQKTVIVRLENGKNSLEFEINRKQKQIKQIKGRNSYNEGREKQNEINELIMRQNLEKKWQLVLTQLRERYQKQISELKDQIRILIVKIQSMQDNKSCYDGLTTSVLTSSKLAMSSASNQSFRFTPNNSFSSSIKESLSRRDAGPLRTPSKSSRQSNNFGYLLDRTNI